MVTTSQAQTAQFDKIKNALYKLRERIVNGDGWLKISTFCQEVGMTHHFVVVVEKIDICLKRNYTPDVSKQQGINFSWIYKNDMGTDEVDNNLVKLFFSAKLSHSRDISNKAKERAGKVITSATKLRVEQNPNDIQHQIIFLRGELEKEKLVKGYLRAEYEMYFKTMLKNLDTLHALKSII